VIYFQGTDDKLWRANPDGSSGVNLGGFKTKSTPVAYGNYIYFQGTDNTLWRINLDGSGGVKLGGYQTKSAPFLTAGFIYFQGTDNQLWKVELDGTNGVNLGGYQTKSTPIVSGQYVYFQGTDNKLWRINTDGSGGINLALYQTNSSPFVTQKFVYFQGTDDTLWQCNLDGTGVAKVAGYKTSSSPYVTDQYIFFRGTDDKLWRVNLDGSGGVNLGGYKTKSSPVVDTPGLLSRHRQRALEIASRRVERGARRGIRHELDSVRGPARQSTGGLDAVAAVHGSNRDLRSSWNHGRESVLIGRLQHAVCHRLLELAEYFVQVGVRYLGDGRFEARGWRKRRFGKRGFRLFCHERQQLVPRSEVDPDVRHFGHRSRRGWDQSR